MPTPTAALRASTVCSAFTLGSGTARYSTERVRGTEPSTGSCRHRGCLPVGAVGRALRRLRKRYLGGAGLQGVRAERRWRKVRERSQGQHDERGLGGRRGLASCSKGAQEGR